MAPTRKRKKKNQKPLSLSSGRPPITSSSTTSASLSSRATRTLIRTHHTLQHSLSRALASNNTQLINSLETQIAARGGLQSYQTASKQGQSSTRGGDSSWVLVEWLSPLINSVHTKASLRVLEVGALDTKNAISRLVGGGRMVEVTRIDLRSQTEGILEQDFMARSVPRAGEDGDGERFHVVSLSLVLNFVPEAEGRGQMLRRVGEFLVGLSSGKEEKEEEGKEEEVLLLPCLFLVLPAACVSNSRYLTEEHLVRIMGSLGFAKVRSKVTAKLVYSLWTYEAGKATMQKFGKKELRPGGSRNNFAITLR